MSRLFPREKQEGTRSFCFTSDVSASDQLCVDDAFHFLGHEVLLLITPMPQRNGSGLIALPLEQLTSSHGLCLES